MTAADQKPQPLAPENRAEVNRLLQEYRAAGKDLGKKQEICRKVLAVDPAAARLMRTTVERDLQPQVRKYLARFQAQATATAKRRVGKLDLSKVVEMRRFAHDLQNLGDGFTKQVIVEKIDPIVKEFRAAFILDRGDVLDKSPELQAERTKLETLGRVWDRCQAKMPRVATSAEEKSASASFESYLQSEEEMAASAARPQDARTRAVMAANAKLAEQLDPEEARAILELNITRSLLGLSALAIDLRLCEAARSHSQDMQRLKFFSHESPVPRKKTVGDRALLAGTTASAENISTGASSGKAAHEGWFHSPGHHKNQMGNAVRIGVGRSGSYYTEIFGS